MSDTMGAEAFWESIGPTSATWATSAARYEDLKRAAEEAGQCTGKHWSEAFTDREADALLPFLESVGGVSESLFVAPLSDASGAQEWAHFLTLYERDLETLRAALTDLGAGKGAWSVYHKARSTYRDHLAVFATFYMRQLVGVTA